MSRFRTTGTVSKSVAFAGLSIGRQIKNSAYGMFEDSLTQIESIIPTANFSLKLPRVIVVGERSVGKSSLLENFTKCAIFPRGKGTCTKMPVRLQIKAVTSLPKYVATVRYMGQPDINLTTTDDVFPAVQSLMDQAQGISATEITVEISQVSPATGVRKQIESCSGLHALSCISCWSCHAAMFTTMRTWWWTCLSYVLSTPACS